MVIHGNHSSTARDRWEIRAPIVVNTATKPRVTTAPTARARATPARRVLVGRPAVQAQEEGQVGREHGEAARVHRGHHPGREGERQRGVDHASKPSSSSRSSSGWIWDRWDVVIVPSAAMKTVVG